MMVNGIINPCSRCGKAIPKGKELFVSCQELNFTHGKSCNCQLQVGAGCYKIVKNKEAKKWKE